MFWIGWEPGTQYVYKYVGRSTAGIHKFKQQNAVVELESTVTVQSIDEYTLAVQVSSSYCFLSMRTDNEDCFFLFYPAGIHHR
jgi:hypothetical protein